MADGTALTLGTAEVKVTADLSQLQPGFDRAQEAARKFEAAMQRPTSLVSRHFAKMAQDADAAAREAAAAQAKVQAALDKVSAAAARQGNILNSLVRRYTSAAGVFMLARQAVSLVIASNDDASKSYDRLHKALADLASNAAPPVIGVMDELSREVEGVNRNIQELIFYWGKLSSLWKDTPTPGFGKSMALDKKTGNWAGGAEGFPASGITDLTAEAKELEQALATLSQMGKESAEAFIERMQAGFAEEEKLAAAQLKHYNEEADRIYALSKIREKMYDDWRISEDKRREQFDKNIGESLKDLANAGVELDKVREAALERELEQALEYLEELGEESADSSRALTDDWIQEQQRAFDEVAAYWENVTHQMDAAGKDFFTEFVATGIADFESLADKMISTWTSTLYDMAKAGKLFGEGGLFGGSGAGLGGILNSLGSFAAKWVPVVGAVVGIAKKIFAPKPSDNRSVATFTPGMTDFGFGAQSTHESSDNTLSGVEQAAAAIQKDISALRASGVQFTQELLNIWLGERDESTFQLSGGGRVGTGSVGDAQDLAIDALNALLKSATSSDPMVAGLLKKGAGVEEIGQALEFSKGITDALLEITDPLEYALTIWERTARANLAMAEQTGFSLDKVREYNAALYQQMVSQFNAGAIASVTGLIGQLQYGSLSAASPGAKYESGLAEFEKLRTAALGGGAKEIEAFTAMASSFLPQARDHLGTSKAYGMLESSTLSTLSTLLSGLQAPQTMPDLSVPLQAGFSMTVGSIESLTEEVKGLRADNQNLTAQLTALARQIPA